MPLFLYSRQLGALKPKIREASGRLSQEAAGGGRERVPAYTFHSGGPHIILEWEAYPSAPSQAQPRSSGAL